MDFRAPHSGSCNAFKMDGSMQRQLRSSIGFLPF